MRPETEEKVEEDFGNMDTHGHDQTNSELGKFSYSGYVIVGSEEGYGYTKIYGQADGRAQLRLRISDIRTSLRTVKNMRD